MGLSKKNLKNGGKSKVNHQREASPALRKVLSTPRPVIHNENETNLPDLVDDVLTHGLFLHLDDLDRALLPWIGTRFSRRFIKKEYLPYHRMAYLSGQRGYVNVYEHLESSHHTVFHTHKKLRHFSQPFFLGAIAGGQLKAINHALSSCGSSWNEDDETLQALDEAGTEGHHQLFTFFSGDFKFVKMREALGYGLVRSRNFENVERIPKSVFASTRLYTEAIVNGDNDIVLHVERRTKEVTDPARRITAKGDGQIPISVARWCLPKHPPWDASVAELYVAIMARGSVGDVNLAADTWLQRWWHQSVINRSALHLSALLLGGNTLNSIALSNKGIVPDQANFLDSDLVRFIEGNRCLHIRYEDAAMKLLLHLAGPNPARSLLMLADKGILQTHGPYWQLLNFMKDNYKDQLDQQRPNWEKPLWIHVFSRTFIGREVSHAELLLQLLKHEPTAAQLNDIRAAFKNLLEIQVQKNNIEGIAQVLAAMHKARNMPSPWTKMPLPLKQYHRNKFDQVQLKTLTYLDAQGCLEVPSVLLLTHCSPELLPARTAWMVSVGRTPQYIDVVGSWLEAYTPSQFFGPVSQGPSYIPALVRESSTLPWFSLTEWGRPLWKLGVRWANIKYLSKLNRPIWLLLLLIRLVFVAHCIVIFTSDHFHDSSVATLIAMESFFLISFFM